MFHIYSIPISGDNSEIYDQSDILNNLITFIIPWTFRSDIMEDNNSSNSMLDYFTYGDTNQCNTSQCYFSYNPPEILDWSKAYMNKNETDMILKNIQKSKT